jgi:predicted nucleic acid-binding Zn ribbon protein
MPRYEFLCECSSEPKTFTVNISFNDYKPVIPCPCGNGEAKRVFNSFSVQDGLTAKEKQFGTTTKRKQMAEFVKDQKDLRKKSYDPNSREAKTNEYWTGKEGLDGITSLPISKKD